MLVVDAECPLPTNTGVYTSDSDTEKFEYGYVIIVFDPMRIESFGTLPEQLHGNRSAERRSRVEPFARLARGVEAGAGSAGRVSVLMPQPPLP